MNTPRILVVDDHPMLRNGLVALFKEMGGFDNVMEARNGAEAIDTLAKEEADIVLLDLNMQGQLDLVTSEEIKARYPRIRIIVYSMHEEGHIIRRLKKAGISGYVLKRSPHQQIVDAVRSAAMGREYWPPEVNEILHHAAQGFSDGANGVNISRREREVLLLMARELSNGQIAEVLGMSQRTVETHKRNLTRKLGVRNMVGLVRYAIENEDNLKAEA